MKSHKDLVVWQESMLLVKSVYEITKSFPPEERLTLASQLRRSAISVPSNIAEGAGRNSRKEWIRFLYIAQGSLAELETQIKIAEMLGYTNSLEDIEKKIIHIRIMIAKLISSLNASSPS